MFDVQALGMYMAFFVTFRGGGELGGPKVKIVWTSPLRGVWICNPFLCISGNSTHAHFGGIDIIIIYMYI